MWSQRTRQRFEARLFDVSELMRNIQGRFARWYNTIFDRRSQRPLLGRALRLEVVGEEALLDTMLYVELNAVRARLVERCEDWRFSSLHRREVGKAEWLIPRGTVPAFPWKDERSWRP